MRRSERTIRRREPRSRLSPLPIRISITLPTSRRVTIVGNDVGVNARPPNQPIDRATPRRRPRCVRAVGSIEPSCSPGESLPLVPNSPRPNLRKTQVSDDLLAERCMCLCSIRAGGERCDRSDEPDDLGDASLACQPAGCRKDEPRAGDGARRIVERRWRETLAGTSRSRRRPGRPVS